jgi:hypothetical protein
MDKQATRAWVDSNRQVARRQLARWDAVDPSRLLEACAIIESLLDAQPAVAEPGESFVFDKVFLTGFTRTPGTTRSADLLTIEFLPTPMSVVPSPARVLAFTQARFVRIEVTPE